MAASESLNPQQFGHDQRIEVITGVPPFKPFHKARKMQSTTTRTFAGDEVDAARDHARQQTGAKDTRYVMVKMPDKTQHVWSRSRGWSTK